MSGVGCIKEGSTGSPAEIREWMSGNICPGNGGRR